VIAHDAPLPDGTLVRRTVCGVYAPSVRKVYSVSNWGYCAHLIHPPIEGSDCLFARATAILPIGSEIIITDEKTIRRDYELVEEP